MGKRRKLTPNQKILLAGVIVAAIGVTVPVILHYFPDKEGVSRIDRKRNVATAEQKPSPTKDKPPPADVGKSTGNSESWSVNAKYHPSGMMGDTGDITIQRYVNVDRFIYEPKGRGPHEWDYKYVNGALNDKASQFAGVMYLDPPNNWGKIYGGFDLRNIHRVIKWEARSLGEEVLAEFVIGGVVWMWDEKNKEKITAPYPDSKERLSLGIKRLTQDWQSFEYSLSDQPIEEFERVVGGFGWVISWGSNNVLLNTDGTGSENPKTFTIEICNISYER